MFNEAGLDLDIGGVYGNKLLELKLINIFILNIFIIYIIGF